MSGTDLTARAEAMLANMPPYEADDEFIQDFVNALAKEFQRLQDYVTALVEQLRPQNADDTWGLLSLYELLAGLPVKPEAVSEESRRARVLTAIARSRGLGIGEGWAGLITLLLNSGGWYEVENEPGAYEITLWIPFPSTSYQAGGLKELLSRITPAHIRVNLIFTDAFLVGDLVGDPL
jgi:Bacteriophage Mu-like, Gp48